MWVSTWEGLREPTEVFTELFEQNSFLSFSFILCSPVVSWKNGYFLKMTCFAPKSLFYIESWFTSKLSPLSLPHKIYMVEPLSLQPGPARAAFFWAQLKLEAFGSTHKSVWGVDTNFKEPSKHWRTSLVMGEQSPQPVIPHGGNILIHIGHQFPYAWLRWQTLVLSWDLSQEFSKSHACALRLMNVSSICQTSVMP